MLVGGVLVKRVVHGLRGVREGARDLCNGGRTHARSCSKRGETVDLCSVLAWNVLFVKTLPPSRKPFPSIRTRLRGNLARY